MTPDQEYRLISGIMSDLESAMDDIKRLTPTPGTMVTSHLRNLKDMIQFYDQMLEEEFEDDED